MSQYENFNHNYQERRGGFRNYSRSRNTNNSHGIKADTTWLYLIGGLLIIHWFIAPLGKIWRNIFGFLGGAPTDEELAVQSQITTVYGQTANGFSYNGLPHDQTYYEAIASGWLQNMEGIGTGNFTQMYQQMSNLNASECTAVYIAFGTPVYGSIQKDLLGWFNEELSTGSWFTIDERSAMRSLWNSKGAEPAWP